MAAPNIIQVRAAPSLWDIELANTQARSLSSGLPIVLLLARNTSSRFFADITVAKLISTLADLGTRLVIRDNYESWVDPDPSERFLTKVDGVAAVVYCTKLCADREGRALIRQSNRLENAQQQAAPVTLREQLCSRILRTAKLEEVGSERTYIAIDPDYSVPKELTVDSDQLAVFEGELREIFREFGVGEHQQKGMRAALYTAVFEIFMNTFEHGMRQSPGGALQGLRALRFSHHIGQSTAALAERAGGFEELESYITRQSDVGFKRFLEISVTDAGPGIIAHYCRAHALPPPSSYEQKQALLNQLLTQGISSKSLEGAGYGLPAALGALHDLKAFVSVRTDDLWFCRDFGSSQVGPGEALHLAPVKTAQPVSRMEGTQFNILMEFLP